MSIAEYKAKWPNSHIKTGTLLTIENLVQTMGVSKVDHEFLQPVKILGIVSSDEYIDLLIFAKSCER